MTLDAASPPPARATVDGPVAATWSDGPLAAGGGRARFVTADAVRLDLPVAQLGSRMLARMIDLVAQVALYVVLAVAVPILLLLASAAGVVQLDSALSQGAYIVLVAVVVLGYPVAMETLTRGRTLGKFALGLRVVRDDGGPIRFRQAMTRGLVSAAIEWPGLIAPPLTWLAALWSMAVSPQAKRLGDYAAGTLVIHERTATMWGRMPLIPPGLTGWAATLDLGGLDDELALAVRHFLDRAHRLREPARTQLAYRLMAEVAAVTRPAPPSGIPAWAYLAAVHAERHRRALHRLAAVRARSAAAWPELAPPPASAPPVPVRPAGVLRPAAPEQVGDRPPVRR